MYLSLQDQVIAGRGGHRGGAGVILAPRIILRKKKHAGQKPWTRARNSYVAEKVPVNMHMKSRQYRDTSYPIVLWILQYANNA